MCHIRQRPLSLARARAACCAPLTGCRVEYFIFGLCSEMRPGALAAQDLNLFAVGTSGALQQFKAVEFLGGDREDMPSQGQFSFEADRTAILKLEDEMTSAFGHACITNFAASGEKTIDLGAKMLRDEHMPTLRECVASGALAATRTLSFNACPCVTALPDLAGMDSLRTLTTIGCTALESLPDLSVLPSLKHVKLEACTNLKALPKLPPGVEWDANHLPEHLREGASK